MSKDDFKYFNQEFDSEIRNFHILDLVKQKEFHPCEYKSGFKKFKGRFLSKEKFYSSVTGKDFSDKLYEHVAKVWDRFEMKTMKDYHDLYLKCDMLLLADVFEKI